MSAGKEYHELTSEFHSATKDPAPNATMPVDEHAEHDDDLLDPTDMYCASADIVLPCVADSNDFETHGR